MAVENREPRMKKYAYPASADDYRQLARRRLPQFLFDYVDGGATAC